MTLKQRVRRVGFIEYAGIAVLLLLVAFGYVFVSPNSKDVLVTIRLADKDLIWLDSGSPKGVPAESVRVGMKETDMFGRVNAEVVRVTSFDQPHKEIYYINKKTVYVTLRLRTSHNPKNNQYRYEGTVLQVGDWVRFTVQSTMINGIVTMVPSQDKPKPVWVTVKTRLKSEGIYLVENEMSGVDQTTANSVSKGDQVKDSEGNVLAEVLDKAVSPALVTVPDMWGFLHVREHPRKVDVVLTLRIAAYETAGELYYLDVVPIKLNTSLPLFFPFVDVEPRIVEIVSGPK